MNHLRMFGVMVVILSTMFLSSCEKEDTTSDDLNGTIWYSLYTPDEFKATVPPSRGYALSFGEKTVVWASLNENYQITDILAQMEYHLKGNTLYIANSPTDYNPNVIYVGGRTYERQQLPYHKDN